MGIENLASPNSWTRVYDAQKVFIHPSYNPDTTENDIALIRLNVSSLFLLKRRTCILIFLFLLD
jgi:hypothetical protein